MDYIHVKSPIGHDRVHQKARRMGLPETREVQQDRLPDVTTETQGHVGTALDGPFAGNTVSCWVVNNVHVFNATGLSRTGHVMIMEADLTAANRPDVTRNGALMSLQMTCPPTTSETGMNMKVKSEPSKGMSRPEEAKEK